MFINWNGICAYLGILIIQASFLFRYIAPEQVPIQYGGLSNPNETDFSPADPVSDITIKTASKYIVELPASEVNSLGSFSFCHNKFDDITWIVCLTCVFPSLGMHIGVGASCSWVGSALWSRVCSQCRRWVHSHRIKDDQVEPHRWACHQGPLQNWRARQGGIDNR